MKIVSRQRTQRKKEICLSLLIYHLSLVISESEKYPIIALVSITNSEERAESFREDGTWGWNEKEKNKLDLIEVKPRIKRTEWLNVYPLGSTRAYLSKAEADASAGLRRVACIPIVIDCEEGEGLA